jgi:hypothetical protein
MLIRMSALALLLTAPILLAEKPARPEPPQAEFVVLTSEAYTTQTPRDCSGKEGFYKGLCEGQGPRRENHCTALLADAQRLHSYVVQCNDPLTAGEKVRGYVKGGRLVVQIDGKTRTYSILKSQLLDAPEKKPKEDGASTAVSAPAQQGDSAISIKSTPEAADITVDGRYSGNTPSVIRLTAGDHEIEIGKPGFNVWKRKMTVTTGGQVTIDATLEKGAPQ